MADIEHKNITDANLHVCKGIGGATAGAIVVADGAGTSATTDNANTPVNLYDNQLRRATLKDSAELVNIKGSLAAGTHDISLEDGNAVTATLAGNVTFTFSNPPASGKQGAFTIILTQDGTGSRIVTWPGTVMWASGTTPTLTTAAAGIDVLGFLTVDGGTNWFGFNGGLNFS